jgi:putative membrane protein
MVAAALLVFGSCPGPSRALGQGETTGPACTDELDYPLIAPQVRESSPALMNQLDDDFIEQAAGYNKAIVAFSKLAVSQAASDSVRTFARRMVTEETMLGDRLTKLARYASVFPPLWLDRPEERKYKKLQSMSGPDFDRQYLRDMRNFHSALIELFIQRRHYSRNRDVQEFIAKNIDAVKEQIRDGNGLWNGTSTGAMKSK